MSSPSHEVPEAEPARPWRPEDGPRPVVWTWPRADPPALWVGAHGAWRWATVTAKQVWGDGTVYYQVTVDLRGDTTATVCLYRWPQPGLRVAHRSGCQPTTEVDAGAQGGMPGAPTA
ncbi:hypothetical protein ACFVY4_26675 [Streptomyces sp. NPDC058299]|uniref:hypothetical protein n=1 Tax=Streptomyces sp. NPDC058299 TaxID=3346435 RepID=UPI0036E46386